MATTTKGTQQTKRRTPALTAAQLQVVEQLLADQNEPLRVDLSLAL